MIKEIDKRDSVVEVLRIASASLAWRSPDGVSRPASLRPRQPTHNFIVSHEAFTGDLEGHSMRSPSQTAVFC